MKVRFKGESFYNGFGLTNGKVYECTKVNKETETLNVIDDEEEEYTYSIKEPKAPDGSSKAGEWEIVEDQDDILKEVIGEKR